MYLFIVTQGLSHACSSAFPGPRGMLPWDVEILVSWIGKFREETQMKVNG